MKSPIARTSMLVPRKQSMASLGEFTIGCPLILKDVLSNTGQPVSLWKDCNNFLNFKLFSKVKKVIF